MSRPVLYVTRAWHGTGGMQQLSHDLAGELGRVYGAHFHCICPQHAGMTGLLRLCARALFAAWRLRGKRVFIHVGDASLLPLGVVLKRVAAAQLSATACGLDVCYPARWYQFLVRRALPHVNKVVCISTATRDEVVARGGLVTNTVIIPCGVHHVPVSRARTPHLLLTVGRLVPRKGVAWFVEHALPIIRQHMPDVRYVVVGAGPEEPHIRAAVRKQRLEETVLCITACSNTERDALLNSAAVFVMPNIHHAGDMEGFGIVCIEASARGTPVAAARLEGLIDAVKEQETGVLFEPQNAQACAQAVIGLLKQPLDNAQVAARTQSYFNWSVLISLYQDHVFAD